MDINSEELDELIEPEKTKVKLTHSFPAKVTAFVFFIILACITCFCAVGALVMLDEGLYNQSPERIRQELFRNMALNDSYIILDSWVQGGSTNYLDTYCQGTNLAAEIEGQQGVEFSTGNIDREKALLYESYLAWNSSGGDIQYWERNSPVSEQLQPYTVRIWLDESFKQADEYAFYDKIISWAYALRYAIWVIGALAALASLVLLIFLMCAAGHKAGQEEIEAQFLTKAPFDLYAVLYLGLGGLLITAFAYFLDSGNFAISVLGLGLAVIISPGLLLAFMMNVAVRIKLGGWWRNTLTYRVLKLLSQIPLLWKTALVWLGLNFLFLFGLASDGVIWVLADFLILPAMLYISLLLRKLLQGSEALAAGDLSYQIDTQKMWGDFQKAGDNLNSIRQGMSKAVEERLKSERFKTELITNVSHDLKTPLTSIINYADLISKEPTDNPQITEYSQVLYRQSERLKKLIDDLVEASKASTGNLAVELAPCDIGVLLTQTLGEYEQKLKSRELELVLKQPEAALLIMADGRLLWRVFDNLMNNIYKYAQSGTRVYLTLEQQGQQAIIAFKNTSQAQLDFPADRLRERFVQGDGSRSAEGNGLGLAIAESLVELQKGNLELLVDGDLFKVTLSFDLVEKS